MNYCKTIQVKVILFCCIVLASTPVFSQRFTTVESREGIEISEKGKKVLFYQKFPKSLNGKYERAGYVHPLYSLNGKILTDAFPDDHPYHHGIFWAWHQIVLNNKKIAEGWTCENISWQPVRTDVHKSRKRLTLYSEMLWKSTLEKAPIDIIREKTKISAYKSASQYRIIDFDIQLFALVDSLKIGGSEDEKGYGGFCLRLKLPDDISFVSQNKTIIPQETAVIAGPWMNIIGSFEGSSFPKTGVIIFCNSTDSEEQPWILRKVTSMQNVPYPGRVPVALSKDGLKLNYRVIIHNGGLSNDDIEKLYQEYLGDR